MGKVAVVGNLSALAAEIIKNISLAGVGEIHLVDDSLVTLEDQESSFLMQKQGRRVEVLGAGARELNPLIQIITHDVNVLSNLNILDEMEVVVCCDFKDYPKLAEYTHERNIKLFITQRLGIHGYCMNFETELPVNGVCRMDLSPAESNAERNMMYLSIMTFLQNQNSKYCNELIEKSNFRRKNVTETEVDSFYNLFLQQITQKSIGVFSILGGLCSQEVIKFLQLKSVFSNFLVFNGSDFSAKIYKNVID